MITVRCKECGTELISSNKIQFCGCPNQMSVVDNKVGANDLDKVVMVSNNLCLLYTSPSPRDLSTSRMPSSA